MNFENVFDSNSITNQELTEKFGHELNTGKVVIFYAKETSNPGLINVYLAQKVSPSSVSRANSTQRVTSAAALLKGWDNPDIILRTQDNYSVEVLENLGLNKAGAILTGMKLRVYDTHEPAFTGHTAIVNRDGVERESNGQAIYSNTELVTDAEFKILGGHDLMIYDEVPSTSSTGTIQSRERVESPGAIQG